MNTEKIQSVFKKRQQSIIRSMIGISVLVASVSFLVLREIIPKLDALAVLIPAFGYAIIINLTKWRCPACHHHLGKLYHGLREPRYCSYCGVKLINKK